MIAGWNPGIDLIILAIVSVLAYGSYLTLRHEERRAQAKNEAWPTSNQWDGGGRR